MQHDSYINLQTNRKIYKNVTREFYSQLEKLLESEFPDEFTSYRVGLIDFQTLIKKAKNSIDKSTKQRDKDLIEKINYLIENNYILNN